MAHRISSSRERTLEALTKFTFPSTPQATLSSLFLDKVAFLESTTTMSTMKSDFSVMVCKVLLSIWARCLQESFVRPTKHCSIYPFCEHEKHVGLTRRGLLVWSLEPDTGLVAI